MFADRRDAPPGPPRHAGSRLPAWVGLGERDVTVDAAAVERLADAGARAASSIATPTTTSSRSRAEAADRIAADQLDFLARVI